MRFEKKFICEDLLNLQIKTFINRLEEEKHDYLEVFKINSSMKFFDLLYMSFYARK